MNVARPNQLINLSSQHYHAIIRPRVSKPAIEGRGTIRFEGQKFSMEIFEWTRYWVRPQETYTSYCGYSPNMTLRFQSKQNISTPLKGDKEDIRTNKSWGYRRELWFHNRRVRWIVTQGNDSRDPVHLLHRAKQNKRQENRTRGMKWGRECKETVKVEKPQNRNKKRLLFRFNELKKPHTAASNMNVDVDESRD